MFWGRSWSCPTPSCKTSGLHCAPGFQDIHCLAPTRSYWMFLSPRAFLPFSRISLCCQSLSRTHKAENIPKCPQLPGLSVPSQGIRRQSQTPESAHRGSHGRHSGTNKNPKSLLRLPRMRHRELNPAESGSCCSPSPSLQTLPALLDPGSRRAQGGTGTSVTPKPQAGAEQLFVSLGCSMELLPVPDCCSGRLTREHQEGFKDSVAPLSTRVSREVFSKA